MRFYRQIVVFSSLLLVGLGIAITVRTAVEGGGIGLLVGPLFAAAGLGRLYLLRRR